MTKEPQRESRAASISLLGGVLCLDFANTVDWRTSAKPEEILNNYRDLVDWARHVGFIDDRRAGRLSRRAASRGSAARRAFEQAIQLREAIYAVFVAFAHNRLPAREHVDRFNQILSGFMSQARITPGPDGFGWSWSGDPDGFDSVLWPVAWSAAELLTSQDSGLVRQCRGGGCGWLFLDKSRSHRRQWFHMKVCGNRAKARRYYERLKLNK